jgi:hypothetical protein
MCIKAKQAMDKAEEFIRKKQMRQRTAILSAAERVMQQMGGLGRGGTGGGAAGTWKTGNNITPSAKSSLTAILLLLLLNSNLTQRRAREGGVRWTARGPMMSLLHCLMSNNEGKGIRNDIGNVDEARDNSGT